MSTRNPHYSKTLKPPVTEEPVDLYFYRPIGFVLARAFVHFRITPNQVTVLSMLSGVAAGILYTRGRATSTLIAGLLFLSANLLDCADGQLARLKGNSSPVGQILDGAADYVTGMATTLGIAVGYAGRLYPPGVWWPLVVLAGLSNVLQSVLVDTYRQRYLALTSGSTDGPADAYRAYRSRLEEAGSGPDRFLIKAYLGYLRMMMKITPLRTDRPDLQRREYLIRKSIPLVRGWTWIGSSMRISIAVLASLVNRPEWYFLAVALPVNLVAVLLLIRQTLLDIRTRKAA